MFEDDIDFDGIDINGLNKAEGARAALVKIVANCKAMHKEGKATEESLGKLAKDLGAIERRLAELTTSEGMGRVETAGEAELRFYRGAQAGSAIYQPEAVRWLGEDSGAGWEPGLLDDPAPRTAWQRDAQRALEDFHLVAIIRGKDKEFPTDAADRHKLFKRLAPKAWARVGRVMRGGPAWVQRAFADTTNGGGEWIPTEVRLPELERELQLLSQQMLMGVFDTRPMAALTEVNPVLTSHAMPYKYGGVVSDDPPKFTASTPGTDERTITAVGWAARVVVEVDAAEDMIVAALPEIRTLIVRTLSIGEEAAILHGDLAASHQDTIATWNPAGVFPDGLDYGLSNSPFRLWEGLRAHAFDLSTTNDANSALTYANLLGYAAQLDPPHGVDGDLVLACSQKAYLKYVMAISEVATLEKYGAMASVIAGEVAKIGPLRVVKPFMLTDDLANTGLYTGSGTSGTAIIFNRSRFVRKIRRSGMVEMNKDIERGVHNLVGTARGKFHNRDASTVKNAVLIYDLT